MTKTPKVIFNSIFTLGLNNVDNKFANKEKSIKRVVDMYKYYADKEKRAMSMYDYYTGKINQEETVNLIIEDGTFATEEELEKRKKKAVKYLENSNLWQGVLSFNNDYINENIDIHKLEKELATNILPMFFKHCGFKDTKKMFYQLALHSNTDNLHFHFSFMEKEPNYQYRDKIGYRRAGLLDENEINFLKNQIIHTIEKEKIYTPLLINTNKELDHLKKYFSPKEKNFLLKKKKDLMYEEKILRLGQLLYNERFDKKGKIKYGSIKNKEILSLTKDIKSYIFSKSNNLELDYKSFKESLNKINEHFENIQKDNNIKNIDIDKALTISKEKYLDNYVYNSIVNYALFKYKREKGRIKGIAETDIIQSIILKHYLKNKSQTRKDILDTYFSKANTSNQFRNKREVEKAIRNVNDEMDEAQKEFSKLFEENKEKTN